MPERIDEFFAEDREPAAVEAFETYCDIVQSKTWRIGESKRRRRKAFEARKKAAAAPPAPAAGA